ncbi:hypothetical protein [Paenibacillus periandrae]|uniref:hypothetical protein n=1 Tax=Paenibacillus periandrae TaxID=1761741 RepID=UPI001F09DC4F|nr:hypothetical protein [Paenibacillus periandrae]
MIESSTTRIPNENDTGNESNKNSFLKLIRRTFFFLIGIGSIKLLRYWVKIHQTDVDEFLIEIHNQGITNADIVRRFIEIPMLLGVVALIALLIYSRKRVLSNNFFFWVYFFLLDALLMYLFPDLLTSLIGIK